MIGVPVKLTGRFDASSRGAAETGPTILQVIVEPRQLEEARLTQEWTHEPRDVLGEVRAHDVIACVSPRAWDANGRLALHLGQREIPLLTTQARWSG